MSESPTGTIVATREPAAGNDTLTARPAMPNDDEIVTLWEDYAKLHCREVAAACRRSDAAQLLPWWAKPGPEFLRADGTYDGDVVDFPAILDLLPPKHDAVRRHLRPSYKSLAEYWTNPCWGADGRYRLDAALKDLENRLSAQRSEEERVGLPALEARLNDLCERRRNAKWRILDLPPVTPTAIASHLLVECIEGVEPGQVPANRAEVELATHRLRNLLPFLSGILADDVAVYLRATEEPFGPEGYDRLGRR